MNKIGFIFICTLYIAVSILSFSKSIDIEYQLLICGILIALVGIPHGAIDHVLFLNSSDVKPRFFFSSYLLSMIAYVICWILFPKFSLCLFLLLSAYHFGESQLSDLFVNKFKRFIAFVLWGGNILSALIYYNNFELQIIFSTYSDLALLLPILNESIHFNILLWSSFLLAIATLVGIAKKKYSFDTIAREVYILILIHIAFYVLPVVAAFTIYFVILHSAKVLVDEFKFLKRAYKNFQLSSFIKQLLPFTLISFIGAAILFLLIRTEILNISYVLMAIILISIITLPHSLVMQRFYTPKI